MLCLETSFLIDWFRKQEYALEFLKTRDATERVTVPTPVLHELIRGALVSESYPGSPEDIYTDLDYVEYAPLTVGGADEAAKIRATLAGRGEPIGAFDSLIAGVARDIDAPLVATDGDYNRVDDLEIINPRS